MNTRAQNSSHPVWDVYDRYRTATLSTKYYSAKLHQLLTRATAMEIVLAVAVPSSAVAGLWFWETPAGSIVWRSLIAVSTVLAVIKPILRLTDKIRSYEKTVAGYRMLENDLRRIKIEISQDRAYQDKHRGKFHDALDKEEKLIAESPAGKIDEKLRQKCRIEVNKELPADSFYVPEEG